MPELVEVESFLDFEALKIIPSTMKPELLNLYMGSHDPKAVELANQYLPCRVFNLSITPNEVIEKNKR